MSTEANEAPAPLPAGDYAIVEILGHRTMVGRVTEVERFGTKLLAIEPLFDGKLLPEVLVGGSSIYQFTPCTAEVAAKRTPTRAYELPRSVAATLPPAALPAPEKLPPWITGSDDDEESF
ncbi:MAG: hypothetical protein K2Y20_05460 [Sphingomonas sp.]|nr:hypothetical protein [Sphingomonas sp.]